MPTIAAAILGALISAMGTLVGRVMLSLGLGYVAYSGLDTLVVSARDNLVAGLQGLPLVALQIASVMKIGVCISILAGAFTTRLVVRGLSSGLVTRIVTKG